MRWSSTKTAADVVELDAGHPLAGRELTAQWVRWTCEETGQTRWTYRVSWPAVSGSPSAPSRGT